MNFLRLVILLLNVSKLKLGPDPFPYPVTKIKSPRNKTDLYLSLPTKTINIAGRIYVGSSTNSSFIFNFSSNFIITSLTKS